MQLKATSSRIRRLKSGILKDLRKRVITPVKLRDVGLAEEAFQMLISIAALQMKRKQDLYWWADITDIRLAEQVRRSEERYRDIWTTRATSFSWWMRKGESPPSAFSLRTGV